MNILLLSTVSCAYVFSEAEDEVEIHTQALPETTIRSPEQEKALKSRESDCEEIYGKVLKSGVQHPQEVKRNSIWEVVDANVSQ
jgi:hypothetical protein